MEELFERECQMATADRMQEETNERKNALEGWVTAGVGQGRARRARRDYY